MSALPLWPSLLPEVCEKSGACVVCQPTECARARQSYGSSIGSLSSKRARTNPLPSRYRSRRISKVQGDVCPSSTLVEPSYLYFPCEHTTFLHYHFLQTASSSNHEDCVRCFCSGDGGLHQRFRYPERRAGYRSCNCRAILHLVDGVCRRSARRRRTGAHLKEL